MFPVFRRLAPLVCLAAAVSCGRTDPANWTIDVSRVDSPAGASSSEPQLSVSNRGVLLSWIEQSGRTTVLKFAERTSSGWTAPVTAASGSDWFLSYADVPSVMRKNDGTLVAQWLRTTDASVEGYDLLLSYSRDNGKTWAPPFAPHHDGTRFQHGFASLMELPGNGLGVVWLDGRNSEFRDEDPTSGTMMFRYAAFDSNWKQTVDAEIDHNVCECCSTAAIATAAGPLVAFRDHNEKEIRDIAVSRLENGKWTPARTVHDDNWEIFACPVNGPALDGRGEQAVVTWFTVKNDCQATRPFQPMPVDRGVRLSVSTIRDRWAASASRCWTRAPPWRPGLSLASRVPSSGHGSSTPQALVRRP